MSELKIANGSELLTVKEAGEYLKVSGGTIYHWTFRKILPVVKLGRLSRYRKQDLDNFINQGLIGTNENQSQITC